MGVDNFPCPHFKQGLLGTNSVVEGGLGELWMVNGTKVTNCHECHSVDGQPWVGGEAHRVIAEASRGQQHSGESKHQVGVAGGVLPARFYLLPNYDSDY